MTVCPVGIEHRSSCSLWLLLKRLWYCKFPDSSPFFSPASLHIYLPYFTDETIRCYLSLSFENCIVIPSVSAIFSSSMKEKMIPTALPRNAEKSPTTHPIPNYNKPATHHAAHKLTSPSSTDSPSPALSSTPPLSTIATVKAHPTTDPLAKPPHLILPNIQAPLGTPLPTQTSHPTTPPATAPPRRKSMTISTDTS